MLYSYLLDPTYSSHRLGGCGSAEIPLEVGRRPGPSRLTITGRLAGALRGEVEQAGLAKLYEEMDLAAGTGAGAHGTGGSEDRHSSAGPDVGRTGNVRSPVKSERDLRSCWNGVHTSALRSSWGGRAVQIA